MTDTQKNAAVEACWPATCDGIEQDAFEAWAKSERMNMDTHPLHWLFLDPQTSAARNGWKAGLVHAADRAAALSPSAPEAPSEREVDRNLEILIADLRSYAAHSTGSLRIDMSDVKSILALYDRARKIGGAS